ncbi:hypothetical protein [Streptomyces sp. NPDC088736]|uniref:hypothetical protein n=1 Tax=Streptomyces sp. NPDC088736 TaxID=3365881 RepID=UPI003826E1AC
MNEGFVDAPQMLPMPRRANLGIRRIEGKVCVWCGISPSTYVKLGPRIRRVGSVLEQWFPIGCRPCTGAHATGVHTRHLRTCARCTHREYCPDEEGLRKLAVSCS